MSFFKRMRYPEGRFVHVTTGIRSYAGETETEWNVRIENHWTKECRKSYESITHQEYYSLPLYDETCDGDEIEIGQRFRVKGESEVAGVIERIPNFFNAQCKWEIFLYNLVD